MCKKDVGKCRLRCRPGCSLFSSDIFAATHSMIYPYCLELNFDLVFKPERAKSTHHQVNQCAQGESCFPQLSKYRSVASGRRSFARLEPPSSQSTTPNLKMPYSIYNCNLCLFTAQWSAWQARNTLVCCPFLPSLQSRAETNQYLQLRQVWLTVRLLGRKGASVQHSDVKAWR